MLLVADKQMDSYYKTGTLDDTKGDERKRGCDGLILSLRLCPGPID